MSNESSQAQAENPSRALEGGSEPTPVVFIIGAGLVGTTLAAKLLRAGVPVAGLHGRQADLSDAGSALAGVLGSTGAIPDILSESQVVIISVRDARIPEVAQRLVDEKRLRPGQVLLHTSGNHPAAEMLSAARKHVKGVGTLHPLIAVTDAPGTLENLAGAYFGIEGDEDARRQAQGLVRKMGGRPLPLTADNMSLYHAAAVMASNYVVALADIARALLVASGVPEADAVPALVPLMTSAVRNVAEVGLPSAMTGPAVRGDVGSIERHVSALQAKAPDTLDLYRRLGREVLRIARKRVPDLDGRAVEQMAALFGGDGEVKSAAPAASKPKKK
jgi:predicted short-subunit dehydrogenase-like oxidoreductase (DUF2520 family)